MWLGVDFSGYYPNWGPGVRDGPVWLAILVPRNGGYVLKEIYPVQRLPGIEHPFMRLRWYLANESYTAAAIDAPFSVPVAFVHDDHAALLRTVDAIPCGRRPFPGAIEFVMTVADSPPPLTPPKPLRQCEVYWSNKGVNVRSTLWAGPRGGAAMTAACLKLLANVGRPLWPWVPGQTTGCIVEAFPAAQLRDWGWPHQGYTGTRGKATRQVILKSLAEVISLGEYQAILVGNDNALDAVLCAFAALAVSTGKLAIHPSVRPLDEGWIAVHDKSLDSLQYAPSRSRT